MIKHHPRKPPASSFMGLLGSKSLARIPGKGSQDGLDQLHTPLANGSSRGSRAHQPHMAPWNKWERCCYSDDLSWRLP